MHRFGFLLSPEESTLEVMVFVEALRAANKAAGRSLYVWRELHEQDADSLWEVESVVVFGRVDAIAQRTSVAARLRSLAARGRRIGSVGQGVFSLAAAGLLSGAKAAVPWSHMDCFRELYPDLGTVDGCFVIDRNRFSCCGQLATADLAVRLIEGDQGTNLAVEVADALCLERIRCSEEPQGKLRRAGYKALHPKLATAIAVMEENLEEPVSLDWVAQAIDLSPRQLQRLFRVHFQESPSAHYMRLRLKRAKSLVEGTDMQISEVAVACGFVSLSHFSRRYRMEFDSLPGQGRSGGGRSLVRPVGPESTVQQNTLNETQVFT
ncbi:MAG: helix-turn-helix domain-containing protein [Pseudomonadota bacterium]